jgi:hypothetical protein
MLGWVAQEVFLSLRIPKQTLGMQYHCSTVLAVGIQDRLQRMTMGRYSCFSWNWRCKDLPPVEWVEIPVQTSDTDTVLDVALCWLGSAGHFRPDYSILDGNMDTSMPLDNPSPLGQGLQVGAELARLPAQTSTLGCYRA